MTEGSHASGVSTERLSQALSDEVSGIQSSDGLIYRVRESVDHRQSRRRAGAFAAACALCLAIAGGVFGGLTLGGPSVSPAASKVGNSPAGDKVSRIAKTSRPAIELAGFTIHSLAGSMPSTELCAPLPTSIPYIPYVNSASDSVAETNSNGGCIEAVSTTGNQPNSFEGPAAPDPAPASLSNAKSVTIGQYGATLGTSGDTTDLVIQYPDPGLSAYHYDLIIVATEMTPSELQGAVSASNPQLGRTSDTTPPCTNGCG